MRINTNMAALNAWRSMTINNGGMTKSLEKLSSGYRVNRAADDAAGLAVSEKMRAQIRGLNMAVRNAQDGVSMVQTAEGGAQKIQDMLQRIRELAVQASTGSLTSGAASGEPLDDVALLQKEVDALVAEIDRTAKNTKFNTKELLSGNKLTMKFYVGSGSDVTNDTITYTFDDLTTATTGLSITGLSLTATDVLATIDSALSTVNEARAGFGAVQNRLESAIQTLQIQSENLTAAESRIRDVDMAQEMATFTKYQILQQASTAMLAQANQSTQSILSLLR